MGKLSLAILDWQIPGGIEITITESGEPFEVVLEENYALLYVANYPVSINGTEYLTGTTYNSKDTYPLQVVDDYAEYLVFDEQGNFSEEFIQHFTMIEH